MSKQAYKAKNEIFLHTLLFFIICMVVLLVIFLMIGNVGEVASYLDLEKASISQELTTEFCDKNDSQRANFANEIKPSTVFGTKAPHVCIYSTKNDYTMVKTQLFISKQPYSEVSSLSDVSYNEQLLMVQTDSLNSEDINRLYDLTEHGVSLLFLGLPDSVSLQNDDLLNLLGIKRVIGEASWNGIRTSSDLLTGTLVDMPNYRISGIDVVLAGNNKIYACALPVGYVEQHNFDLPPIIWRHIRDGIEGRVYIFNGDYIKTEMGYGILPVVISELNENYIYPVVNAYSVVVTGYPYADNESRENWTRLYSRDKMQIQQDMFATQLKKYAKAYDIRLSCFSPDYEVFKDTDDINLKFYVNEIKSTRGLLADENDGKLQLSDKADSVNFVMWDSSFEFWNEENNTVNYPICFDSIIGDERADDYAVGGFASTLGLFSVKIDINKLLAYEGTDDVWSVYCQEQEVMMGKQRRDFEWMDIVTANEAAGRILKVLQMDTSIEYGRSMIDINISNFNERAWFILRSSKEDLKIDNGTIEKTGSGCYFVTLTDDHATISWKE